MAVSATTIAAEAVTSRFVRLVMPEKTKYATPASTVAQMAVWIVLISRRRRVMDRSDGTGPNLHTEQRRRPYRHP